MGRPALVSALLVGAGACEVEDGSTVARADSAGVEIVTSGPRDVPLDWTFQRELELGGAEEGPEAFHVVTPFTVAAGPEGHLFVLDVQANRVVEFTGDGEFVRAYGGEGSGPGELGSPGSVAVAPDGTVSVFDFSKGSLVRFSPTGDPLPERLFRFYPWPEQNRHFVETADGSLVATMIPSGDDATFRQALQRVGATDTVVVAHADFPRPGMVRYPSCGGGLNLPRIFEIRLSWAPLPGGVVVAGGATYDVAVYRDRALVRRVRRDLPGREATRDDALAELGEGFRIDFGRGPCVIPPHEMVERRGFAGTVPWIDDVVAAASGELWVRRREVGAEAAGPVDVFDPSGAYVGSLPADAPFPLVFVDEDRFGAVETDELDVSRLVVYRIDRG